MKDGQFLEEEIELLKLENAGIKKRLLKIEQEVEAISKGKEVNSPVFKNVITEELPKQETIKSPDVKSDSYPKTEFGKNDKIELEKSPNNGGILLIVFGALLCMTGVGIILGIPLIIAGIYKISNSKNKNKIITEKVDHSDDFNLHKPIIENVKDSEDNRFKGSIKNELVSNVSKSSFEEEVGIKWFARIGILALVVGVGFFIKYAIDLGWINHLTRVIMGVFLGIGLVLYGEIISRKKDDYNILAKTLIGGGLAIIYFIIYGAYHFVSYREAIGISQTLDISLLIIVTMVAIGLSVRDNSKIIAAESFFLGYVTALLSNNFEVITIIYTSLLTAGLVAVVAYKKWSVIGIFGVFASYFLYAVWQNDSNEGFLFPLIILLFYFLAFSIQSFFISKNREHNVSNIIIMLINSGLFFLLASSIVHKHYPSWDGIVALFLTIFYLFGFVLYKRNESTTLSIANLYLGIFFITLFIPIYFNAKLITIIWALEVALLATLYSKTINNVFKVAFNVLGTLVFLKNIVFDSVYLKSFDIDNFIGSTRLFSFLASVISFYFVYIILRKNREVLNSLFFPIYSWAAAALTVLIVFMEMAGKYPALVSMILTVLVFVYMLIGVTKGRKEFFYQAVLVSAILSLKLLFFDSINLKAFSTEDFFGSTRLWTYSFTIFVFYLLYGYLRILGKAIENSQFVAKFYSWLAFIFLILAVAMEFGKNYPVWVSLFLGLLSLIYIFLSRASIRELLQQGTSLSLIVSFKVLFFDSVNLPSLEISKSFFDSRIIPFLVAVSMSYSISFYLSRNSEKLKEAEKALINFYSTLGTFFVFILMVLELKEYWISVGWIFLALLLTLFGFIFNKKHFRIQGIIILFISIFKVFIYDIRELEVIYRTISYIVLGIILLLISFIYTKYKDKIREII